MSERGHRRKIKLIKINTPSVPRIVFGKSYPDSDSERHYPAGDRPAPVDSRADYNTIDIPLPVREQTILSYRVGPAVRRILNGYGRLAELSEVPNARHDLTVDVGIDDMTAGVVRQPGSIDNPPCESTVRCAPSHGTHDGALELRLSTCNAGASYNAVTGRQLR